MSQINTTQTGPLTPDEGSRRTDHVLWKMALVVLLISITPAILNLLGVDFGSRGKPFDAAAGISQTPQQLVDQLHLSLSGSFTHTILEWSAFCTAIFTVVLAFVVYRIKGDLTTPIIGVALFWAGCMDAFHTLAADRLIEATADNTDLIPFTWAICRAFNALIVMVGAGLILLRKHDRKASKHDFWVVGGIGLIFGVVAYGIIHYCATSALLPRTMFPNLFVTRPWDAIAFVLFLIGGGLLFKLYRRVGGAFAAAILASTIADVVTQLHMTLGSTALFDNHFNIAHFLKIVTYLVPFAGITIDVVSTYQKEKTTVRRLSTEITERCRIERKLRNSEALSAAIVETAPDAIIIIDDRGIIQSISSAAEELFGHSASQVAGKNVNMLMPSPYAEEHDQYIARYTRGGPARIISRGRDIVGLRKDGSTFPMYLKVGEFHIDGKMYFTGIARDITELKADEEQLILHADSLEQLTEDLQRKNTELDEFTHVASHDLQEPLRKLVSFSSLLRKDVGDELTERAETDLKYITDAANRMQLLVRDLLTLSRTGRAPLKLASVQLDNCATRAIEALSEAIASSGASVTSDNLSEVKGDATLLTQLYQNLIGNAIKYCKTTPIIHLTVEHGPDGPIFGVKDNGIGINKEYQEQIFVAFKRLHSREQYEGTGIGLATCRKVIERHGGELWVESQPNNGSHFKFTLNKKAVITA